MYVPERRASRDFALSGSGEWPGDSIADIPDEDLLAGFRALRPVDGGYFELLPSDLPKR